MLGNFYHFHVRDDLRRGRLIRILPDYESKSQHIFAIVPHRQILRPQAEAFIAFVRRLVGSGHDAKMPHPI